MFDNIATFSQLFESKLESLLAEEVLVNDKIAFEQVIKMHTKIPLYNSSSISGCHHFQDARV